MKHDKSNEHQDNLHDICGTNWESPSKGKTVSKTKSPSHSAHHTSGVSKTKSTATTPKAKKSTTHTAKKPTTHTAHKPTTSNLYDTEEYVLVEEIVMIEEDF